jgi:hypothetical protein
LINRQRKICKKIEPSNSTWFPSCTWRCSTVSVAPFTPESSRSDQSPTEETELHPKESKETPLEKSKPPKLNDTLTCLYFQCLRCDFQVRVYFQAFLTINLSVLMTKSYAFNKIWIQTNINKNVRNSMFLLRPVSGFKRHPKLHHRS